MTGKILRFKAKADPADINLLAADVLLALAFSAGVDPNALIQRFWREQPGLRPADLIAAIGLAHKLLSIFEMLALGHDQEPAS